jgi:hypothetical protein
MDFEVRISAVIVRPTGCPASQGDGMIEIYDSGLVLSQGGFRKAPVVVSNPRCFVLTAQFNNLVKIPYGLRVFLQVKESAGAK